MLTKATETQSQTTGGFEMSVLRWTRRRIGSPQLRAQRRNNPEDHRRSYLDAKRGNFERCTERLAKGLPRIRRSLRRFRTWPMLVKSHRSAYPVLQPHGCLSLVLVSLGLSCNLLIDCSFGDPRIVKPSMIFLLVTAPSNCPQRPANRLSFQPSWVRRILAHRHSTRHRQYVGLE